MPLRKSEETNVKQIAVAEAQGASLRRAMDTMAEETGNLQQQRAGDYLVACAVEQAEGLYEWHDGSLRWTAPASENAHIEVVVCDPADGRFLPGLEVTVAVRVASGREIGRERQPLLWHPWLPHYGRNWTLPGNGEYDIHVSVGPLPLMRHDKVNGSRFTEPAEVTFRGVQIATGQKTS